MAIYPEKSYNISNNEIIMSDSSNDTVINTTDILINDLKRIETNVKLNDTYLRQIIKREHEDYQSLQNTIGRLNEQINLINEWVSLPWYKRIFKSFKK